ncbi:MAG: type II toxin-antitoxin system VapC family toxin [Phycisphaerae bacterium]
MDASAIVPLLLSENGADRSRLLIDRVRGESGYVPDLFFLEIANIIIVGERRGRIDISAGDAFLNLLDDLPLYVAQSGKRDRLLQLAMRHGLTAYDAAYLELAARQGLPLATLDRQLATAALAEGVALID